METVKLSPEAREQFKSELDSEDKSMATLLNSENLKPFPIEQRILLALMIQNGGEVEEDTLEEKFNEEFLRFSLCN